jgi:Antitoxin VbhA
MDNQRPHEDIRREHVKAAIADSRIEGLPSPSRAEQDILDAYIRGEIDACDLVEVYKQKLRLQQLQL